MFDRVETFEPAFKPYESKSTTEHSYINTDNKIGLKSS